MRILKTIVTVVSMIVWSTAHAQVPHTFQANTPALASQVNENFAHLEQELTALTEHSPSAEQLEQIRHPNVLTPIPAIESIQSSNGDIVQLLGEDHIVATFPFLEFGSGVGYKLNVPVPARFFAASQLHTAGLVTRQVVQHNALQSEVPLVIAGFPAYANITESMFYRARDKQVFSERRRVLSVSINFTVSLRIIVGQTEVRIPNFGDGQLVYESSDLQVSDTDFSDNITIGNLDRRSEIVSNVLEYVRHVSIALL